MPKKILLINPPYPLEESPSPPFGLISLAAYLIEKNHDVMIEDYIVNPCSRERLRKVIGRFNPDVIGSTGVTMNINTALGILKDCRDASPESAIIMGGPHVTFDAQDILSCNTHVDFIVRGEGEITCAELLEKIDRPESYRGINGISYRENGAIVHNETREFISDINMLPYPARHLVQLSKYKALDLAINMITSRGCPYQCIFCVGSKMVGKRVRYFDVNRVVDEFEMLAKYGFKQVNIVDDLFTSNKKRCIAICDEIVRRGIRQDWTAFARVDTVSRDLLETLKTAGCTMLCFGIESGNQEILDRVKKKTTLEKIRSAIELCKEVGIAPMASYIMGLPGETPETVKQTMDFAKKLCASYGYHILAPFPGTEVREKADDYGIRILTSDWDRYDANRSVCEAGNLPYQEVDRIVNEFNDGINRLVRGILKKYENGEQISEQDRAMVDSVIALDFNYKLISQELVESYSTRDANGGGLRSFIDYISQHSGLREDVVSSQVDRLFRIGCLDNIVSGGKNVISWSHLTTSRQSM